LKPYHESSGLTVFHGDWIEVLREMPDESLHCVVTSPPYWNLRDYSVDGQLGREETPDKYIQKVTDGFRDLRRVLRSDGTCWLNLGDSYSAAGHGWGGGSLSEARNHEEVCGGYKTRKPPACWNLKKKDLVGIPWRAAFALQEDGWYLRSDIVWSKKNCMPESVTDRPTRSHEYIFLLTKSERYFYDHQAIKEPAVYAFDNEARKERALTADKSLPTAERNGIRPARDKQRGHSRRHAGFNDRWDSMEKEEQCSGMRNKRSVWEVSPMPFPEAHFATFPPKLIEPCILAGTSMKGCCVTCSAPWERILETSELRGEGVIHDGDRAAADIRGVSPSSLLRTNGRTFREVETLGWQPTCKCAAQETTPCTVIDPFFGAGTTGLVARKHGCKVIGIELSEEYIKIALKRLSQEVLQF
jgi:DNA modification methylase